MKFGISFLPDLNGNDLAASNYFKMTLEAAQIADQCGMNTIKITEHYLHPYGGFCSSPLMFLSAISSVTKRVRLMTGCILPIFHHPIHIASHVSMLDAMSQGRVDVGFSRAYLPYEFKPFGIEMDGNRDRYEQTIETTIQLWTRNNVTAKCPFFSFQDVSIYPKTIQQPHPPVWGAAVMSRQNLSWLGEKGFHLLVTPPLDGIDFLREKIEIYLESYSTHHPDREPNITLSMPLLIDESNETALHLGCLHLTRYLTTWSHACSSWGNQSSRDYPGYHFLKEILQNLTAEKMMISLQAIAGSPERVMEAMTQLIKHIPCTEIIWQIDFGAQPTAISLKTLHLFVEQIMPHFS